MQPKAFVAKWRNVNFGEKQASQEMFLDICALVEHPTPVDQGDRDAFTLEKRVPNGVADAYLEGNFVWEFKGSDADLDAAMTRRSATRFTWGRRRCSSYRRSAPSGSAPISPAW